MAGGMILMASLTLFYSVAGAMIIHGLVQIAANGSRSLFLRSHIQTRLIINYLIGAAVSLSIFIFITAVPNGAVIFLILGSFPMIIKFSARFKNLNITNRKTSVFAGFTMTTLQLLAGVSGPVLDAFYQNSKLSRLEIVANKALTQTLSHLFKVFYYFIFVGTDNIVPIWFIIIAMMVAILATRFGTNVLNKWNDISFRQYTNHLISVISLICLTQGIYLLINQLQTSPAT
jgi:hypothetical protein